MQERIKAWAKVMESLHPDEMIEVPEAEEFWRNRPLFESCGFTVDIFKKLFPIVEQRLGSILALFCLGAHTQEGANILEIGSGRGGSLSALALSNPSAHITNIDRFEEYAEDTCGGVGRNGFTYGVFKKNTALLGVQPNTIFKWSDEAVEDVPDEYFDLIFVDGNHGYDFVMRDIENYSKKLKSGGILCGHDYHPRFPGVIRAVKDSFGEDGYWVAENSSVWVRAEDWMNL